MWVFPGGQVDPADEVPSTGPAAAPPDELAAARRAAIREAREEAGLVLEEARLVPLSYWVPPKEALRRFTTWFFIARASASRTVAVDGSEIREHLWIAPADALEARDAGRMELVAPTYVTLCWLSRFSSVHEALSAAASRPAERYRTHAVTGADGQMRAALWEGDAAYCDGDLEREGPRRRLLVNGPRWVLELRG